MHGLQAEAPEEKAVSYGRQLKKAGCGGYRMPGGTVTKAEKRAQMQRDFNRKSPRKGKRR